MEIKITPEYQTISGGKILRNINILTEDHKGKPWHITNDELEEMNTQIDKIRKEVKKWSIQEQSQPKPK